MQDLNIRIDLKIYELNELSSSDRELVNIACEELSEAMLPIPISR